MKIKRNAIWLTIAFIAAFILVALPTVISAQPTGDELRWVADTGANNNINIAHDATYVDVVVRLVDSSTTGTDQLTLTLNFHNLVADGYFAIPASPFRPAHPEWNMANGWSDNTALMLPHADVASMTTGNPRIANAVSVVRLYVTPAFLPNMSATFSINRPMISPYPTSTTTFTVTRLPQQQVTNHNVTFNLHGGTGSFPAQSIPNNTVIARPATNPARTGFTFVDWYTAETGGTLFDFNAPITAATVIHARWAPIEGILRWEADNITIPFDATYVDVVVRLVNTVGNTDQLTLTVNVHDLVADGYVGIPAAPFRPQHPQWSMAGNWADNTSLMLPFANVASMTTGEPLPANPVAVVRLNVTAALLPNESITVPLNRPPMSPWPLEVTTFTITRLPQDVVNRNVSFNLHGGAGNFPAQTVPHNTVVARPAAVPTLANHTFVDWYDAATGGAPFDFATPITADTVIHARWVLVNRNVSFNLHGGTGNFPAQTVPHNTVITRPAAEPTLTGHTFVDWYNAATNGAPFNFAAPITADTVIHARWEPPVVVVNHTVTFNLQGGTGNAPAQTVANGSLATRPAVNPTRAGYNFVNWFTAPTGGTVFNFATPITADTVVYARWTAQPTTPPGGGDGGTGGPSQPPTQRPPTQRPPVVDENDNDNDNDNDNEVLIPIDPTPVMYTHYAYMIGFEDGTVRPQANITRAEATTIFFRLISDTHRSSIWSRSNAFSDVELQSWYNTAISTMDNGGFVAGYPDGSFRPNQSITRAEMTALVVRFMGYGHLTNVQGGIFSDTQGHWAQDAINAASRRGWVTGFEDGTFRPDQPITRAEAAALINRMLGRLPQNSDDLLDGMLTWPDNMNVNAWYYLYIQEATNSHYHVMKANGVHETWTQLIAPRDWRSLELPN